METSSDSQNPKSAQHGNSAKAPTSLNVPTLPKSKPLYCVVTKQLKRQAAHLCNQDDILQASLDEVWTARSNSRYFVAYLSPKQKYFSEIEEEIGKYQKAYPNTSREKTRTIGERLVLDLYDAALSNSLIRKLLYKIANGEIGQVITTNRANQKAMRMLLDIFNSTRLSKPTPLSFFDELLSEDLASVDEKLVTTLAEDLLDYHAKRRQLIRILHDGFAVKKTFDSNGYFGPVVTCKIINADDIKLDGKAVKRRNQRLSLLILKKIIKSDRTFIVRSFCNIYNPAHSRSNSKSGKSPNFANDLNKALRFLKKSHSIEIESISGLRRIRSLKLVSKLSASEIGSEIGKLR